MRPWIPVQLDVVADSQGIYNGYQAGTDSNNTPVLTGIGDVFGDGSSPLVTENKNRSMFAAMHYEMAVRGMYPKGGKIGSYCRAGSRIDAGHSKPIDDLLDALMAATDASGPPYPAPGRGEYGLEAVLFQFGTNDAGATTQVDRDQLLVDYKAAIDRAISGGSRAIIVGTSPARHESGLGSPETEAAETASLNERIRSLQGYRGVCQVYDLYSAINTTMLRSDGLHLNALGGVTWARIAALALVKALALGGTAGSVLGLGSSKLNAYKLSAA